LISLYSFVANLKAMKREFCVLIILLMTSLALRAQVSGKIEDEKGQPVSFAGVSLLNPADSSAVLSTQSNENGEFMLGNAGHKQYLLRVSMMGHQTFNSQSFELTNAQPTKDFATIILKENSRQLATVIVRSTRPLTQQRADGTVVNVESSIVSKGSSALEVLERSPGVAVDRQNNGLSLNGKNGVQVMINGKLLRLPIEQVVTMLSGMRANDISRIELLTNPSAAHDAEGSGGLINIVMKENHRKGTTGSFSATGGYGYGPKAEASMHIDHNQGKLHLYGSYNFNHDRAYSDFHATGSEQEPLLGGLAQSDYLSTTKATQNNHAATAGFEFKPDSLTTLGGGVILNDNRANVSTVNHGSYLINDSSLYRLDAAINGINHWRSLNYNAFLDRELGRGQKINLDLDYIHYTNKYPIGINSSFTDKNGNPVAGNDTLFSPLQKGLSNTLIRLLAGQVNYSKQFNPKVNFSAGLKETYTRTSSNSGIASLLRGNYATRPTSVNNSAVSENISAAYAALELNPDSLTNIQAGLRFEYSSQSVAGRNISALFPNLLLTRTLSPNSQLFLSYSKRISRPSFADLASYVTYNGPQSVNTGNPLLRPTLTNTVRLGYRNSGYALSLLLSHDKDPIARHQTIYTPDSLQMAVSPQNLRYQNNITLQATLPFRINSWWEMNYDLSGGWRKFMLDYTPVAVTKSYFAYNLQGTQLFRLSPVFSAELSGYYNSMFYNGSRKVDSYGALNAGLKLDLKNNGGSLQFSVSDLLRTGTVSSYFGSLTREAFDLTTHVLFHPESTVRPIFKLTYSRSFGNGRSIKRVQAPLPESERIGN